MKVCYVTSSGSIHDERFIDKLITNRHEIHFVSFCQNNLNNDKIHFYNFDLMSNFESLRGIPIIGDPIRIICYSINLMRHIFVLKRLLKKIKPDVVHGGWVQEAGFICALTGYHPFLLMPWGSDILIKPKKSIIKKMIARYTINKADMIYCDCEYVKNEIIKISGYPKNKITTFPQIGINLKKFNKNKDINIRKELGWEEKKILIMVRSFKPVYGIEYFLNALTEIIKNVPDTRIILCGDGHLRNKFINIIKSQKLEDFVFFAGSITNDKMPKYLNNADIYVSSSLSDGTSLSLLEAMACGLPVIVTDVPAIMEWVSDGKNGFVVPRKDSKMLAVKTIQLLQDEALQNKFSDENLRIATEMADWDKNFARLENVYKLLAKSR